MTIQRIFYQVRPLACIHLRVLGGLLLAWILLLTTSCVSCKDVVYPQDATVGTVPQYTTPVPHIVRGDMLGITVNSKNRELSEPSDLSMVGYYSAFGTSASNTQQGYIVDSEGYISLSGLGHIHVDGLTRNRLNTKIAMELRGKGLFSDAIVTVSLLNAQMSILDEMTHPGRFPMVSDQVSILDTTATAGDLTIRGHRDDVLVIWEVNGERHIVAHDLCSDRIFDSPCYFLRQGDIVYIEPNDIKAQMASINPNNNVGIWLSVTNTATLLTAFIFTIVINQRR